MGTPHSSLLTPDYEMDGCDRMITKRIIPCLDVKDGRVVKGVNFLGLNDVSDPVELAAYYSAAGADELVFYGIFHDVFCI